MSGKERGRLSSLSGAWSGVYFYPRWSHRPPVPFNATF